MDEIREVLLEVLSELHPDVDFEHESELVERKIDRAKTLIREGRLPAYRVTDHAIRLDRADVTGYLESRRIQPPPPPTVRRRKPAVTVSACEYYPGMKVV